MLNGHTGDFKTMSGIIIWKSAPDFWLQLKKIFLKHKCKYNQDQDMQK